MKKLQRLATYKPPSSIAIVVEWDGGSAAVPYTTISAMSEGQIEDALRTACSRDDIHAHWNDDDSIAIAFGQEPSIWPEDE